MSQSADRIQLKLALLRAGRRLGQAKNGKLILGNWCPLCGKLCVEQRTGGEVVYDRMDLHEAIISRGDARGNPALLEIILETDFNVALICSACNVSRLADTKENTHKLVVGLVSKYGRDTIVDWIRSLPARPENIREWAQRLA